MDGKFIVLPTLLLAHARHRAAERGFSDVTEYVAELVRKDTGGNPGVPVATWHQARLENGGDADRSAQSASTLGRHVLLYESVRGSGFGYACGPRSNTLIAARGVTGDFLENLSTLPKGQTAKITAEVKRLVTKLNKLNTSCSRPSLKRISVRTYASSSRRPRTTPDSNRTRTFTAPWRVVAGR